MWPYNLGEPVYGFSSWKKSWRISRRKIDTDRLNRKLMGHLDIRVRVKVFNSTFITVSAISWGSVLLIGDRGVHGELHRPAAIHWHSSPYSLVSSTTRTRSDI